MPPSHEIPTSLGIAASNGALTPNASSGLGNAGAASTLLGGISYTDPNYDVWDPQHWMLDGLLDFNYTYAPALEGA
jgi:hypothetical protein